MESISFEFARAIDDPLDRTLCVRVLFGKACIAQRSIRLRRDARLGQTLLEMERVLLRWANQIVKRDAHIEQQLDSMESALGEPF